MKKRHKIIVACGISIIFLLGLGIGLYFAFAPSTQQKPSLDPSHPQQPSQPHKPNLSDIIPDNQQLDLKEQLSTPQSVIFPTDFVKTNLTQYISQQILTIKNQFGIDYTALVIKNYINEHQLIDTPIVDIKLLVIDGYTPVRFQVQMIANQDFPHVPDGFNKSHNGSQFILTSTTYYPSKLVSQNVNDSQYEGFHQQAYFYKKDILPHPRKLNDQVYETELNTQYQKYGFKYPGYNCNYELKAPDNTIVPDGYLHLPDGQIIDMEKLVLQEKPSIRNDKGELYPSYADGYFIRQQIATNSLKKHPAAENFYSQNVLPETLAIDTEFMMSTAPSGIRALGLYAPAGELIKIQISPETYQIASQCDMQVAIEINENYWNNRKSRPDSGRVSNRYPKVASTFVISISDWVLNGDHYEYVFGTPFGGNISIRFPRPYITSNDTFTFGDIVTFQINNAVKSLAYFDGFTTEADWNQQIEDVINQKITSPNIAILSTLYKANIPFSDPLNHICGNIDIKDFVYPRNSCKKWNDFLLLSNNFKGNYQGYSRVQALDMKFCDDIWGGAGAWGGSMVFYCPIKWGANTFLKGGEPVNFNNWGVIHEINHNFELNNAFFKLHTHPETNIVNLFNLSILSNSGRFRSEVNINDGFYLPEYFTNPYKGSWEKLSSMFNVTRIIRQLKQDFITNPSTAINEWVFYAALIYTLGSRNFSEFANYNVNVFPNENNPQWSPVKFIAFMSHYFNTNLWYLCKDSPPWASADSNAPPKDPWPQVKDLTPEEKQLLGELDKRYPAIDFIANQYATGQYLYNMNTEKFDYTSDITTAYQIPAFDPYTFDFENYIVCANPNFEWDKIYFNPTTKLGGSLKLDENNHKRLIYTPNPQQVGAIDEFNIVIAPTKASQEKLPTNYVPGYAWKIKVRQNVNKPVITSYLPVEYPSKQPDDKIVMKQILHSILPSDNSSDAAVDNLPLQPWSSNPVMEPFNEQTLMALSMGKISLCKYEFNYVVPQTSNYYISSKWDDGIKIMIDDKPFFERVANGQTTYYTIPEALSWKQGDIHKISIALTNITPRNKPPEKGIFDLKLTNQPDLKAATTTFDLTHQILSPTIDTTKTSPELIKNYLNGEQYQYQDREIDYTAYEGTSHKFSNNYGDLIPTDQYGYMSSKINDADTFFKSRKDFTIRKPVLPYKDNKTIVSTNIALTFHEPQNVGSFIINQPSKNKDFFPNIINATLTLKDGQVKVFNNLQLTNNGYVLDRIYQDVTKVEFFIGHYDTQSKGLSIGAIDVYQNTAFEHLIPNDIIDYTWTENYPLGSKINSLLKTDKERWETWGPKLPLYQGPKDYTYVISKICTQFTSPQTLTAIEMTKGDYWQAYFPEYWNVKLTMADNTVVDLGWQKNHSLSLSSVIIDFDGQTFHNVTNVDIDVMHSRTIHGKDDPNRNGISIGKLKFSKTPLNITNAVGINDPAIKLNGQIVYEQNDPTINYTNINSHYLKSSGVGDIIEFSLTNTDYFKIFGRKNVGDGMFDVYINDQLVKKESCNSTELAMNVPIFVYRNESHAPLLKVKIVNQSTQPIYLSSLLLYGKDSNIY